MNLFPRRDAAPELPVAQNALALGLLSTNLACPDCRTSQIIENTADGQICCTECGLILQEKVVDTRSEWRTFADSDGDDPSRVGGPTNPLDGGSGLESMISFKDNHTGISKDLQRAAQRTAQRSGDKNLSAAYQEIQNMCDTISLPRTIADIAKQLFKRQDEEKLLRGKAMDAISAACIFIACRQASVPRSFKEIVTLSNVPQKQITACFKILARAFDTSANPSAAPQPGPPPTGLSSSAEGLVTRFCNHLGLTPAIQSYVIQVVRKSEGIGHLAGRSPISIASGCIAFTTALFGMPQTYKAISDVGGMSESTIRQVFKILLRDKEQVIDPQWKVKGHNKAGLIADEGRLLTY